MIKLTKKYFGRSKSPTTAKGDTSSISSSRASTFLGTDGDDTSTTSKNDDSPDRKTTIVPGDSGSLQVLQGTSQKLKSSSSQSTVNSSSKLADSSATSSSAHSRKSHQASPGVPNTFKPGLLTIKVYHGHDFQLPFDLNFDKNLISRLIQCSSGQPRSEQDELIKQLNSLSLDENKVPADVEGGEYIPANITIPSSSSSQSPLKNALIYFTLEFDKTILSIEADSGSVNHPVFNKVVSFDVSKLSNKLNFQVFLKLPKILLSENKETENNNQQEDILIGSKTLNMKFDNISNPIRLKSHDTIKLDNEFPGFEGVSNGGIVISIDFKPNLNKHLTIDDFDLLKVIGKGSFGKVMQVRKKDSSKVYALKAIRKSNIIAKNEVIHTLSEKTVLATVNNPFIVPLKFSFQSPEKLYLVLSFINGGELFYHLQKAGRFDLSRARFYTSELLSALECLHNMNVIYRDLKPENILLDYKGHIALCDFGLCKLNMKNDDETKTFCGTPEYLAPELLLGTGYTKSVDWWTLGILLYEMLTGLPPYYDEDTNKMYQKILKNPLKFPEGFDKHAQDLLIKLLSRDPKYRLGSNGSEEIKNHSFFRSIDFQKLENKQYIPPFIPGVKDNFDTSNFDQEFTSELPVDSVVNEYLSDSVQKQFGGWTYVGTEHLGDSRH
jgi:serum/glucocorticoid-regulated kinase 2